MTHQEADAKFLRRILFTLVVATVATGSVAGFATVNAGQAGPQLAFGTYGTNQAR